MNDRGRAYRRLRIYGDTHPNYRAGFLHTDDRVGKTSQCASKRPRRCTWVNVYDRRGSFMVHHVPCKVVLYTYSVRGLPFHLSLSRFRPAVRSPTARYTAIHWGMITGITELRYHRGCASTCRYSDIRAFRCLKFRSHQTRAITSAKFEAFNRYQLVQFATSIFLYSRFNISEIKSLK